jgi:hypothetical protein
MLQHDFRRLALAHELLRGTAGRADPTPSVVPPAKTGGGKIICAPAVGAIYRGVGASRGGEPASCVCNGGEPAAV